jgi:hypothetical protein
MRSYACRASVFIGTDQGPLTIEIGVLGSKLRRRRRRACGILLEESARCTGWRMDGMDALTSSAMQVARALCAILSAFQP